VAFDQYDNGKQGSPPDPLLSRATVYDLYGVNGEQAVQRDWVDWYSSGPILADYRGLAYQPGLTERSRFFPNATVWAWRIFP
jgi:hypothetical protein